MTNQTKKPNIIWLFGDQHRAQALGYNGDPNVSTPNIDNLCAFGTHFSNAVAGTPLCCPYRGSLLSGKYPHKSVPGHERQLPPDEPTIATVFNENGYDTAYIGKWHLDGFSEAQGRGAMHIIPPERRGDFKDWIGYENNNAQWDCWVHGDSGDDAFHYRLPGYETDELTNLFIDYLHKQGNEHTQGDGNPFFAVLSVQPPHDPYIAPEEFRKGHIPDKVQLRPNVPNIPHIVNTAKRDLAGYYAMIENWDWNVGRIMQTLAEEGLLDNTHIVFFSDHGDMHGSHGQFRKTNPFEESIRVPFVIAGGTPYTYKNGTVEAPINHVDIAPTSLGLCGIEKPDWMMGTDYSHYRMPKEQPVPEPDSAFLQLVIPTRHGDSTDKAWRGIVTKDGWKYVCFEAMPWLLFNLKNDPYEQVNLAHNTMYESVKNRLNERLRQWMSDTDDTEFVLPE